MNENKLTVEEASAIAEVINIYLPKEHADYQLMTKIHADRSDLVGMINTIDDYLQYLDLLCDHLDLAAKGLRKTSNQLHKHSDVFKRRYLERVYSKEE